MIQVNASLPVSDLELWRNEEEHMWASFEFHKPTYNGEMIDLEAKITELRHKAISVEVRAYRTKRLEKNPERDYVAIGSFVFVTRKGETYINHGLSFDD